MVAKGFLSKIITQDDTTELFKYYLIFNALFCLIFPNNVVVSAYFGASDWHIPFYIASGSSFSGALPFYREYLFVTWVTMPLWVAWFGRVYAKNYSSDHIRFWPLMAGWIFSLLVLLLIIFMKPDYHEGFSTRGRLVAAAARYRFVGFTVFPVFMGVAYVFACLALAKFPIDLYRIIKRHA